jgi:hypothetical protein
VEVLKNIGRRWAQIYRIMKKPFTAKSAEDAEKIGMDPKGKNEVDLDEDTFSGLGNKN